MVNFQSGLLGCRGAGLVATPSKIKGDWNYACNLKHALRLLNPTTDNSDNQIITPPSTSPRPSSSTHQKIAGCCSVFLSIRVKSFI
jgi:hypothetical protein